MQWASSAEVLTQAVLNNNVNPTRKSVWEHPITVAFTKDWGVAATPYRDVIEEIREYAAIRWTSLPENAQIGDLCLSIHC